MQAACSNPAALGGGSGALHAYLSTGGSSITGSAAQPQAVGEPAKAIDTPFVSVPGLLTAQCVSNEKGSYLEVTVHGNPSDPRTDEITGDVMQNGQLNAGWGLHLIDVNLAMGNLRRHRPRAGQGVSRGEQEVTVSSDALRDLEPGTLGRVRETIIFHAPSRLM